MEAFADDMKDRTPDYEPVFTDVYQYYGNPLASFTNTIDDLILHLRILIKLKVQILMTLYSVDTVQYHWMQKHIQEINESTLKYYPKLNILH